MAVSSLGIGLQAQPNEPSPKPSSGLVERELKRRADAAKIQPEVKHQQQLAGILGEPFVAYNEKPMEMPKRVAMLCGSILEVVGPHESHYSSVFSNALAEESMRKGKTDYPVGSIVLKAKYADKNGTQVELMTLMIKREKGYNPEHGDWEYQVTNPRGWVLAQGKIDSCIKCHDSFAKTGYVSRWFADATKGGERNKSWDKVQINKEEDKGSKR